VFRHACKLGLERIVSKRKDSPYRSGCSPDWFKMKNANAPAVKRVARKDWGRDSGVERTLPLVFTVLADRGPPCSCSVLPKAHMRMQPCSLP
jgi:hypothetical protein